MQLTTNEGKTRNSMWILASVAKLSSSTWLVRRKASSSLLWNLYEYDRRGVSRGFFKDNIYKIGQIRGNKKDLLLDFERDG